VGVPKLKQGVVAQPPRHKEKTDIIFALLSKKEKSINFNAPLSKKAINQKKYNLSVLVPLWQNT